MKIQLKEAMKIYEKYGPEDMPLVFLSDIYLNTGNGVLQITQGMKLDETQFDMLIRANIMEFDVVFTDKLLAKLISTFPSEYRYPQGRKNLIEMDRMIDNLENSNRMTKRKRFVLSCTEIYKKNASGMYEVILRYGEKLSYKRWNEIKVKLNRNTDIDYRIDECGIIVFVILKAGSFDYMKRFMTNTELISLIVEHREEFDIQISPDFNVETDIYAVNTKEELLQVYVDTKAKLVIAGGELDNDAKTALAQLKRYDRYARMMVVKNPDPSMKRQIILTIKKIYNQNPWESE